MKVEVLDAQKIDLQGQVDLMTTRLANRDELDGERGRQLDERAVDSRDRIDQKNDTIAQLKKELLDEAADKKSLAIEVEYLKNQNAASKTQAGDPQATIRQKGKMIISLEEAKALLETDNANLKKQVTDLKASKLVSSHSAKVTTRTKSGWCGSKQ